MNLPQYAREQLDKYGLHDWSFRYISTRSAVGRCDYHLKQIQYSEHYLVRHEADQRNTILHEIAHALAGPCAGHGPKWKAAARKIGARPVRCARVEERMIPYMWKQVCDNCGDEVGKSFRRRTSMSRCVTRCCGASITQEKICG